jgi:hypothetical protein
MYYKDYAFIPTTIFNSSVAVANGLVGILPLFMGLAVITNTFLYNNFRFDSISSTMFTLFYNGFGDTVFDTFYGAQQVSP